MNITKSELFTVYNKLRAELKRQGNTKGIERLNKALGILQSKAYYTGDKIAYRPESAGCGCKDWQYRSARKRAYTGPCKHMLAEILVNMILEYRQQHNITAFVQSAARWATV